MLSRNCSLKFSRNLHNNALFSFAKFLFIHRNYKKKRKKENTKSSSLFFSFICYWLKQKNRTFSYEIRYAISFISLRCTGKKKHEEKKEQSKFSFWRQMATDNSATKNQTTSIIVITGNEQTCQNLLAIIQKSGDCTELGDLTTHVVSVSKSDLYDISYKVIYSRPLKLLKIKQKHCVNVGKPLWRV